MKQSGRCPKCDGDRIVFLPRVGDATDFGGTNMADMTRRNGAALVPRRLAERASVESGLFGSQTTKYRPACAPEAYICATCGYVEEYVIDVAAIDWSEIHGAQWHAGGSAQGELAPDLP